MKNNSWTEVVNSFDDFWDHKPYKLRIRNDSRTLKNFKKRLSESGSFSNVDTAIKTEKNNKETLRRIAVSFYDYLRGKGITIESELDNIRFYDYPFERQLEIAKFLHIPHTTGEIMERFSIDARTARSDIAALRDGIEVLGTYIQIEEERKGRQKCYKSSLNPVFLPLNLTEVYALTVYMPRVAEKTYSGNAVLLDQIASNIKAQLSTYAFDRLFPGDPRPSDPEVRYENDESLAKSKEGILMYLMKTGKKCSFFYKDIKYSGSVIYSDSGYRIKLEDGRELDSDLKDVDFIIEDLEYR